MIKDGDNVICLLFMVVRWLVFGIELKFKLIERYLLFLVLIIEIELSFCINRRCCIKGKYKVFLSWWFCVCFFFGEKSDCVEGRIVKERDFSLSRYYEDESEVDWCYGLNFLMLYG